MRTVITGGPKTGKTTAALADGRPVYHTDDTMHMEWSEASAEVAKWFDRDGPWIIEGVAAPRALRKWLAAHPKGMPCDEVIVLSVPMRPIAEGQRRMAKGVDTVFDEIADQLRARGVQVRTK